MNFDKYDDNQLISFYGQWLTELKKRNIIRTNNVVGEIGEFLAVNYYNNHAGLPKMLLTMESSANVDAISRNGKRYSIKTTTGNTTGVFYGFNSPNSYDPQEVLFEYVIVVCLDKDYTLKRIIEIDYETFMRNKKWHSRMSAWHLTITNKLIKESKIIFQKM